MITLIKEEIKRRMITQQEAANLAGISGPRLSTILRGYSRGIKTIRAMLTALNITVPE